MSNLDILGLLSTGFEQMRNVRDTFLIRAYYTTKGIVVAIHSDNGSVCAFGLPVLSIGVDLVLADISCDRDADFFGGCCILSTIPRSSLYERCENDSDGI